MHRSLWDQVNKTRTVQSAVGWLAHSLCTREGQAHEASKAAASEGEWGQGPTEETPHVHPSDRG